MEIKLPKIGRQIIASEERKIMHKISSENDFKTPRLSKELIGFKTPPKKIQDLFVELDQEEEKNFYKLIKNLNVLERHISKNNIKSNNRCL